MSHMSLTNEGSLISSDFLLSPTVSTAPAAKPVSHVLLFLVVIEICVKPEYKLTFSYSQDGQNVKEQKEEDEEEAEEAGGDA